MTLGLLFCSLPKQNQDSKVEIKDLTLLQENCLGERKRYFWEKYQVWMFNGSVCAPTVSKKEESICATDKVIGVQQTLFCQSANKSHKKFLASGPPSYSESLNCGLCLMIGRITFVKLQ